MDIRSKFMITNVKKMIVALIFAMFFINVSSYDNDSYFDCKKALQDTPCSFKAVYLHENNGNVYTREMIVKTEGDLYSLLSNKNTCENRLRQILSVTVLFMTFKNFWGLFFCANMEMKNLYWLQISVTKYIHKIDGKKRAIL